MKIGKTNIDIRMYPIKMEVLGKMNPNKTNLRAFLCLPFLYLINRVFLNYMPPRSS